MSEHQRKLGNSMPDVIQQVRIVTHQTFCSATVRSMRIPHFLQNAAENLMPARKSTSAQVHFRADSVCVIVKYSRGSAEFIKNAAESLNSSERSTCANKLKVKNT